MTVAAFVHPFNPSQSVLVCRAAHLSPAMQVKLITLALRDGYQVIVVGQRHPDLSQALGTPTPACTPDAIRADLVEAPSAQHALAHVRCTPRNTFILHTAGDVIGMYAAVLVRPGTPASVPATPEPPAPPRRWDGRVGRHAAY
ncbi:hypothetical protein [Deinococcus kurensis]|uniref:hypothetical protein n=1 Tax=Deinococcus kurensis TaxID=2662757 RepID=UPI0012D2F135|nr:hypothetical protein [Deinococcus kurensis]